jgi:broad specificity phosphatase PhoE
MIFFVRHGETDYPLVEARGVRGWATSFAPLTAMGRLQIDTIAQDYRLQSAEAILSSTFARALESGARLGNALNTPLYVEYDLHEWLPQKDPLGEIDPGLLHRAHRNLRESQRLLSHAVPWETIREVEARVLSVLTRYQQFSSVIVVTHAVVIGSIVGMDRLVDHAEIVPTELDLAKRSFPERSRAQI